MQETCVYPFTFFTYIHTCIYSVGTYNILHGTLTCIGTRVGCSSGNGSSLLFDDGTFDASLYVLMSYNLLLNK